MTESARALANRRKARAGKIKLATPTCNRHQDQLADECRAIFICRVKKRIDKAANPRGGGPLKLAIRLPSVSAAPRNADGAPSPPIDAASIEHFLKMEQRWLFLSRSHEFAEQVSRFTGNLGSGKPK